MIATAKVQRSAARASSRVPRYVAIPTPLGEFRLYKLGDGSLRSTWNVDAPADPFLAGAKRDPDLRPGLVRALTRYFAGAGNVDFGEAETPGGTQFFRRCWDACRTIPHGQTRSYAWLAKRAGSGPKSARAAGQAMRCNPLPVIIPCHRVVASDGRLHGFAGCTSGAPLNLKRALLELEGAIPSLR